MVLSLVEKKLGIEYVRTAAKALFSRAMNASLPRYTPAIAFSNGSGKADS
jgi:hypothetical protein